MQQVHEFETSVSVSTLLAGPVFLFIVDCSSASVASGFTSQFVRTIKSCLSSLKDNCRIGIITMADELTVFNFKARSEFVIRDLSDVVLSCSYDAIMPTVRKGREAMIQILDSLETRIPSTSTGHCIGSAYIVARMILATTGGLLIAGFSGLPIHGPYPLSDRTRLKPTEFSLMHLPPDKSGQIYRDQSFRLSNGGVAVHLFICGSGYADLPTVGIPSGLTSGSVRRYEAMDAEGAAKLNSDLFNLLNDSYQWDAQLCFFCNQGVRVVRPHVNCTVKDKTIVRFPVVAKATSVVAEIAVESPTDIDSVCVQAVLLYTSGSCRRMIRVFNYAGACSRDPRVIMASFDQVALSTLLCRKALACVLVHGPEEGRKGIIREYSTVVRKLPPGPARNLVHSLFNQPFTRVVHPDGVDGRIVDVITLRNMGIRDVLLTLYPRMVALDKEMGRVLPLSGSSFVAGNCFLFHLMNCMYIWVGPAIDAKWMRQVFGVDAYEEIGEELSETGTKENMMVWEIVNECRGLSWNWLPVEVIIQGSPREEVFRDLLVDDVKVDGSDLSEWVRSHAALG
jgi:protein transport protein SEC24